MKQIGLLTGLATLIFLSLTNTSVSIAAAQDEKILAMVLAHHKKNPDCPIREGAFEENSIIRFGDDIWVVLVGCEHHAYQTSWVVYSIQDPNQDPFISLLSFPQTMDGRKWTASNRLMSAQWDQKSKTLQTFHKGRGAGDCGSSESYRWTGGAFYLSEVTYQVCCWSEEDFKTKSQCRRIKDKYPIPEDEWPVVFKYLRGKAKTK